MTTQTHAAIRSLPRHLNLLAQAIYHWTRYKPNPKPDLPDDQQYSTKFAPRRGGPMRVNSGSTAKKVFTLHIRQPHVHVEPIPNYFDDEGEYIGIDDDDSEINTDATVDNELNDDAIDTATLLKFLPPPLLSKAERKAAFRALKKVSIRADSFAEARAAIPAGSLFSLVRYETGK